MMSVEALWGFLCRTANEGLVRIQYKCLVPIYVSRKETERPLYSQTRIIIVLIVPSHVPNNNVLSPNFHIRVLVSGNMYINRSQILNAGTGNEAVHFSFWEHINRILVQCRGPLSLALCLGTPWGYVQCAVRYMTCVFWKPMWRQFLVRNLWFQFRVQSI
jgi:hypothetical protein